MAKGYKKSDLQNLPACVSEFIKLIIKKMRYRKKVRADVQAELTAHFEDELRNCKSDEEKEQKAQQLIADFGDAKLLAVLLRRAKKRCRPLWRTIIARTFQAIGIFILCLIIYVGWFFSGKPNITVDYVAELNRMVRPVADESLNAAPLYVEAAEMCEQWSDDISKLLGTKYKEATAEQKQLIKKWLTDNEEMLELVIAGSQKPYYWQTYEEDKEVGGVMSVLMPSLAGFRKLARALRWRAQLCAEQGRYEDAFDDMKACYRFGRHIRGDKLLIEQLVGIAIEALAVQTLRDILSEHAIDSAELAALQGELEQIISSEDFAVSLKTERMFVYDEIQRWFTQDRFGGGHISLEGLKRFQIVKELSSVSLDFSLFEELWSKSLHILFTHPNKQESREMVDRLFTFWDKMARKTPAQIRAENIDIRKQAMEIVEGNILLEIMSPAIGRICEIAHRNKMGVEATLTVIAILRYKQDVGNYPENLDELIQAGLLKSLPIDPYSDQPIVYKKMDNNFVLYGLGENFKDDGGMVAVVDGRTRIWGTKDEGDWVFWPVGK